MPLLVCICVGVAVVALSSKSSLMELFMLGEGNSQIELSTDTHAIRTGKESSGASGASSISGGLSHLTMGLAGVTGGDSGSATSGKLFEGLKIRTFPIDQLMFSDEKLKIHRNRQKERRLNEETDVDTEAHESISGNKVS